MKIAGELAVRAPRTVVFDKLKDAHFFASCIDGVNALTAIDDTHYAAVFETRIAYLKFRFDVRVEMTLAERPDRIEGRIEGTPIGMVGRLTATAATRLEEAGEETRIHYAIEAVITGRLGSLGQPVLRAKAKEMERQFADRLAAAFASGAAVSS
jgi:carbon monoxide dehydrogenase subunit G